jgi:hypothetical protein
MRAEPLARKVVPPGSNVTPLRGVGWVAQTDEQQLLVLDDALETIATFRLPTDWLRGVHAVSPDLSFAAVSDQDNIALIDADGVVFWRIEHVPWGDSDSESDSCHITADNLVWATVPDPDWEGPDQWWVLDPRTRRVLDRAQLSTYASGSHQLAHPDMVHVGLGCGEGQDGAELYWGRWDADAGTAVVERLDARTRILADVHPEGHSYLSTPHDSGGLLVHRFPDGASTAECSAARFDASFSVHAVYLDARRIVASLVRRGCQVVHAVLDAGSLEVLGDGPLTGIPGAVVPGPPGTFLTVDYREGDLTVWHPTGLE